MTARASEREIDLAGQPTNRVTWLARLFVRLCQILFWLAVALVSLPIFLVTQRSLKGALGAATTFLFQRLGATFIKIGQIVSTRPDIFSEEFIAPLVGLQDAVPPFPFAAVRRAIEEDFGRKLEEVFVEFEEKPVASASVAQVHRAVLQEAEQPPMLQSNVVAVKVRRPGIVRRAYLDEAILEFGARLVSLLPGFSLISPRDAVRQFCDAVNKQLDLRIEAENNHRFRKNFENDHGLVIPALVEQLCSDRVLTMEFIDGVKADRIRAVGDDPVVIVRTGLQFVARMIFRHGFIHADLHPGNMLFMPGNRIAVFDGGLVGRLDEDARRRYAFFCYYVVAGMGAELARWAVEQTGAKVRDYATYEREVVEVVSRFHDQPFEKVQLTGLIADFYRIARKHRIRFEATFTMANIALVVMEGIGRKIDPKLNITREVRPHLESALALAAAGRAPEADAIRSPSPTVPTSLGAGRYRIRRLLGEGVRKRVYLARDTRLDRDVAIAIIRTEGLDEAGLARINLEARAVARLADHPRIVPVHDSGEEDGVPYVVSQYMGGGTLSGRLLRTTEHRLPLDTALRFADQVCQALEHAHAHGVVHRDVKPENIWLTEDGFAKLGDFGLARTLGRPDGNMEGMTVGTALYMAPEQALGRALDHRSDLYSLGASLYEILTGRPPFEGESVAEVIASHINASPEPPSRRNPAISPALDSLILKLLAKAPENRFDSAGAVRQALRDLPTAAAKPAVATPVEGASTPAAGQVFVGREQEIGKLRKGLDEALAGRGRFFVLVGEPGIGKTRAAELIGSYANRRGCRVLTGRSFEGEGAPAFWPWVQILRAYLDGRDPARLESELGPGAPYVAQIVPEIRELLPDLPALPAIDGEEARFRLFDAIASFFRRAAMTQPLYLLFDDLHWADKPSLLLLQHLVRELAGARLLIVGTYRDVDVQHGHPLSEVLPALRRERAFERILLRGLREDEVEELVMAIAGQNVPASFVRAIHGETEGNPFFIEETLRHLVEEGIVTYEGGRWTSHLSPDEMGLPEGVREVVGRRLSRLSEDCRGLLTTASAAGRDFEGRVLQAVAGIESDRVLELLEEAVAAQIIVEKDKRVLGYRFSHALIRETLYSELGAAGRVRLHRKIAEALESLYSDDLDSRLSELAYHYFEAAPGGDVGRAVDFAGRAARRADAQLAYEEAAAFYDRALQVLETKEEPHDNERFELLLELGVAQWNAGEFAKSKRTVLKAADVAERSANWEAFGRAAVAFSGDAAENTVGWMDPVFVGLMEKALGLLSREDSAVRAVLLGRLAAQLAFSQEQERKRELVAEALAMAKRVGDQRALIKVMVAALFAMWGPDDVEQRLELSKNLVRMGEEMRDDLALLAGRVGVAVTEGELGHGESAAAAFAALARSISTVRRAFYRWWASAAGAGWSLQRVGSAEAEVLVRRIFETAGQSGENLVAVGGYLMSKTLIQWQRGGDNWEAALNDFRSSGFGIVPALRITFAVGYADFGKTEEARAILVELSQNGFRDFPRDMNWMTLPLLAVVIERLNDAPRARILYEVILPYAGRIAQIGGSYYWGSVDRFLGLLAKTLSRFDDAVRHFEVALDKDAAMPVNLARTRLDFARLLAERGATGDRARALVLLGQALVTAQSLELKKLAEDGMALKLELEGVASESPRSSIEAVAASIEKKGSIDVRRATAPNGTVTLLFSDMEGFTEMTERLGDAKAHRLMQAHHEIIRRELRTFGASEIEELGDGFLLAFPKATEALRYAISVQRAFAAYRAEHPEEPIRVRMGLNTGEPIKEGDRFFGKTVILAARISAYAKGDEILVSSVVRGLAESAGGFTFDGGEDVALKGLGGTHRVYGVVWDPDVPARRERPASVSTAPATVVEENVFRREGDFWTIVYEGRSTRIKDAKGLQYVATLLRQPGHEVHAADLVNGAQADSGVASGISAEAGLNVAADLGDAGEVLDPKARADYRERLDSLRSELEEARAMNDSGRAERMQQEIEFITQELSSAFGLGGRARKSAAPTERARKAVSSRISDSIARIRKENADLGAHLANSIQLGVFCRYAPEKPVRWSF